MKKLSASRPVPEGAWSLVEGLTHYGVGVMKQPAELLSRNNGATILDQRNTAGSMPIFNATNSFGTEKGADSFTNQDSRYQAASRVGGGAENGNAIAA